MMSFDRYSPNSHLLLRTEQGLIESNTPQIGGFIIFPDRYNDPRLTILTHFKSLKVLVNVLIPIPRHTMPCLTSDQ